MAPPIQSSAIDQEDLNLHSLDVPEEAILDLAHLDLDTETVDSNLEALGNDGRCHRTRAVELHHNRLSSFPRSLGTFFNLHTLDLSNNSLRSLSDDILRISGLKVLLMRGNLLTGDSLPKDMSALSSLEVLNISGNQFVTLPSQVLDLLSLRGLYVGGNLLEDVPKDIGRLAKLETLYLGGNAIQELPAEVGKLQNLQSLVLSKNKLVTLPSSLACLRKLRSLAIHDNLLTTLPPSIIRLENLYELSLRGNPLVVRFVRDMTYDPPSLQELAARCVKINKVPFCREDLPPNIYCYLNSAQRCVNPKCKGVYFDTRVEHIKFVDFCGKYRIPLLQYLCSSKCSSQLSCGGGSESEASEDESSGIDLSRLRRVLLG
ncbi:leucine-rich repeat-containing protein 58-like [Ornithodoros turicata]|uniref:leucine-rich repeat-containing protein 58-like n=1 Tax=Ornithodoros turicata TaxID=34597 RepID=UPI003138E787